MNATRSPLRGKAGPPGRRHSLRLALQIGKGVRELPASRAQLRRWTLAALSHDAVLNLRFVGRAEAQALNRQYRSRDYAPDVLTFVYPNLETAETPTARTPALSRISADIVLCVPVLKSQARHAGIPYEHRLAHLVIHGVLHAQGFDHEDDDDAALMQSVETSALKRFRIPDPYR